MSKQLTLSSILTESYWGEQAAGGIFIAKDTGRILIARRSGNVDESHTWGTWGGKIDPGEDPQQAIEREIEEETGYTGKMQMSPLYTFKDGEFRYFNFLIVVPAEFSPQLNWEHDSSQWIEFGDWPHPIHFGFEELLYKAGDKIKQVIDSIKKRSKIKEVMDTPPPTIHRSIEVIDKDFVNYIKKVENGSKVGFKNGTWTPHQSPEGGNPTVGYGHKIQKGEEGMLKGISDKQAEDLLVQDLLKAKHQVHDDIQHMFSGVKLQLAPQQEQMLIDFAFNLGNIRGFPKFVRAVLDKDWNTVKREYKRTYKNSAGERKELGRNKDFAQKFLSSINETEVDADIQNRKVGMVDEDTYEYVLQTPFSNIQYEHTLSSRLFSIKKVFTKPEHQGQGHAKSILEYFFQMVKQQRGMVEVDAYTTSGSNFIKHVIERFGQMYNVRIV
jgi:8-oxo-dGTP diphosphatase